MSSAKTKIILKSSDDQLFEVEESVALQSQTIKNMMEDVSDDNAIPLPNVTGTILAKVIEYCKRHVPPASKKSSSEGGSSSSSVDVVDASKKSSSEEGSSSAADGDKSSSDADLRAFDTDFVKVDHQILFDLILAANYLDIKSLLDLTCQAVADLIKDMKVEDVRTVFNITNDFTKEEEEQVRKENAWAFQE